SRSATSWWPTTTASWSSRADWSRRCSPTPSARSARRPGSLPASPRAPGWTGSTRSRGRGASGTTPRRGRRDLDPRYRLEGRPRPRPHPPPHPRRRLHPRLPDRPRHARQGAGGVDGPGARGRAAPRSGRPRRGGPQRRRHRARARPGRVPVGGRDPRGRRGRRGRARRPAAAGRRPRRGQADQRGDAHRPRRPRPAPPQPAQPAVPPRAHRPVPEPAPARARRAGLGAGVGPALVGVLVRARARRGGGARARPVARADRARGACGGGRGRRSRPPARHLARRPAAHGRPSRRFRSDPRQIRGSTAPLVTPLTDGGEVDHEGLRTLVRWQLTAGTHGISLGGSTGEPSAQSIAERAAAIRTVADEVGARVPFVPGTGSAKLDETLELTAAARDAGADAVLVITPYYARPTQEALYAWYSTVAREFPDLPIVAYNVPSRTAVEIAPETVARLHRDHDNFVGIKETTKDFEHFSRV